MVGDPPEHTGLAAEEIAGLSALLVKPELTTSFIDNMIRATARRLRFASTGHGDDQRLRCLRCSLSRQSTGPPDAACPVMSDHRVRAADGPNNSTRTDKYPDVSLYADF